MTSTEFIAALRQLRMSQRQLAKQIEVDVMTVNRWAMGKTEIHGAAKAYLRLLLKLQDIKR